jgi:hypothetical protein
MGAAAITTAAMIEQSTITSPSALATIARTQLLHQYEQTCRCPLELREEHGSLICALCDAPLRRRRRS